MLPSTRMFSIATLVAVALGASPLPPAPARVPAPPAARVPQPPPAAARPAVPEVLERGALRLHFLQHDIGIERYELTRENGQVTLVSHFEYLDRGAAVPLVAELRVDRDLTPAAFRINGKTYRYFSADAEVTASRDRLTIRDGSATRQVPRPARFFTIDGYAPLAMQMMLVRYWLAHPGEGPLATFPAGPVTIEHRGQDAVGDGASRRAFDRYAIDGVVWGRESIWLDEKGAIAAAVTTTSGLPFEAVREDLESSLPMFVARANADRLDEARRLADAIRPRWTPPYALTGATLIDGTGRAPIEDSLVIVGADRGIQYAGPRDATRLASGNVPVVDVRGMTIIPGLWDMHAHAAQVEWGPAYLASGVTTIRDMGGEFEFLVAARRAYANATALGPRMLLAGLIDGPGAGAFGVNTASTPDEARALVKRYHDAGFMQMKLYSLLAPPLVPIVAAEAHRLDMSVTGHIPNGLTLRQAIEAGMDHVAHMPIRAQPGSAELAETIAMLKEHHTVIDPTVSWNELLGHPLPVPIASFQPGVDRLPAPLARMINSTGAADANPAAVERRQADTLAVIKALHDAGVPIVAGTDKGVPGHSVQREIELYVKAGFTPMEALQAATSVPARAMHLERDLGTIEAGRRADLVVLRANPLEQISNIRTAAHVIVGGRLYDCATLWKSVGFVPQ